MTEAQIKSDKQREYRIRRIAKRDGERLVKSRTRNPELPEYGSYMVVDQNNTVVMGGYGHMSLDDIEKSYADFEASEAKTAA